MNKNINKDIMKSSKRSYKFLRYILILLILFSFIVYLQTYYLTNSDISIRNAAAESLNMDPNEFGWRDYSKVTKLDLSGKEISDIRSIRKFKNLKELSLGDLIVPEKEIPKWKTFLHKLHIIKLKPQQKILSFRNYDFTKIKEITSLQNLSQENLIDLSPLKKLKYLESLNLSNSFNIRDMTNIPAGFASISIRKGKTYINPKITINHHAFIDTIPFKSINPISSLTSLKSLRLDNTLISDIAPLKELKNLQYLFLSETDVNNLEPIKNLESLKILILNYTPVSDITPLKNLKYLQHLSLNQTGVNDFEAIRNLTYLKSLSLTDTKITNLEVIREHTNLESLYIGLTKIDSLEPLRGLTNLTQLEIDRTLVSDIEQLKGLKKLHELWMYECKNITDEQVEDLQNTLPNLKIFRHLNTEE